MADLVPVLVVAPCASVYDDGTDQPITRYLVEGTTATVPAAEANRCPWAYQRLDQPAQLAGQRL